MATAKKKPAAKKATAKKTTAKKTAVRKTAAKKAPAKRAAAKKTTAKKATAKKTTARKTVAKKVVKKAAAPKTYKEQLKKSVLLQTIADNVDLSKKDVAAVFENLSEIIHGHMKDRAAGEFTLPGVLKITKKTKPARKARKGVNPFTGEEMMFKAKPASKVVKIKALKGLKEMVEK